MGADPAFALIDSLAALDDAFARSAAGPVLLFLYDPYCPINHFAARELEQVTHHVLMINVSAGRELSRAVEQRTGVRHQSPQALLLHHGQAVWSASHGAIRALTVSTALHDARVANAAVGAPTSPVTHGARSSHAEPHGTSETAFDHAWQHWQRQLTALIAPAAKQALSQAGAFDAADSLIDREWALRLLTADRDTLAQLTAHGMGRTDNDQLVALVQQHPTPAAGG